jgi:hypothetical protein
MDTRTDFIVYSLFEYTKNENEASRQMISSFLATASSREWQTVGMPTTDWELPLLLHFVKPQKKSKGAVFLQNVVYDNIMQFVCLCVFVQW